jgi:hypothetical protein
MRGAATRVTSAWSAAAIAAVLGGCSGEDYPRPPCRSTQGALDVSFNIGGCPSISGFEILPNEVDVGGSVQLLSSVETVIGETPQYTWTASGGVIADPSSASATFTCTTPGQVQIFLSVSSAGAAQDCSMVTQGSVQCDAVAEGAAAAGGDSGPLDAATAE